MSNEPRSVFLGLHSNVHFFASQQGFRSLGGRLKALALLYDHLLFEYGVDNGQIGEEGSFETIYPPSGNPRDLEPIRTRKSVPFRVLYALTGSEDIHTAIHTPTVKVYRAQFITTLQQLGELKADWAHFISLMPGSQNYVLAQNADRLARDWMWRDRDLLEELEPTTPYYWREALLKHLYTDLARSYLMGRDICPDGRHSKLLRSKALRGRQSEAASGVRTLSLLLPDVRKATWEDINDLRQDPGLQNLRIKLRECDAAGGSDVDLIRRINSEYQEDMERHRPSWRKTAVSILWNLASLVPGLGITPTTIQTGKAITDTLAAKDHWTAALMRLKDRAQP